MSLILSKSPTKSKPKASFIKQQASTLHPNIQLFHGFDSTLPKRFDVAEPNPVVIGTKGTVGSLIMQEMDYFNRLQLGSKSSSSKSQCQLANVALTGESSKPKLESMAAVPGKKKRGSKRLIPSFCSMVEVAESNQLNSFNRFTYRSLKVDVNRLEN